MENSTKLTIGAFITLAVLMAGGVYIAQDDDAYYCESRDIVMICEKLSSGIGTRCYYEDTYKLCKEGWKKLEVGEMPRSTEGVKWLCSPEECISQ